MIIMVIIIVVGLRPLETLRLYRARVPFHDLAFLLHALSFLFACFLARFPLSVPSLFDFGKLVVVLDVARWRRQLIQLIEAIDEMHNDVLRGARLDQESGAETVLQSLNPEWVVLVLLKRDEIIARLHQRCCPGKPELDFGVVVANLNHLDAVDLLYGEGGA